MRKRCILCGDLLFNRPLYVCKNMPSKSQDLPTKENVNLDKPIDFNLCQCKGCGLVQFDCEPVPYYLDSTRAGERSGVLIKMRQKQFEHLIESYNLKGKKIIEIGAGKGGFLRTLKEMTKYDIKEYGIENNVGFVEIARKKEGVNVFRGNPEDENQLYIDGPYDAFVSFAYPARLINPNEMLRGVKKNLVDDAVGLIQVPSLEHLIRPGGFYDITADHIAYYSQDTLHFLLQRNGFDVLEQGEIGLYNYAIVKNRQVINLKTIWSDVEALSKRICQFIDKSKSEGKKIAVWCAGHFAFTVLSTTGVGDSISYIIDNASFKQGCYAPASHVKIVGVDYFKYEPVDIIMILGPMYIDEIVSEIYVKIGKNVEIVTVEQDDLRIL